MQIEIGALRADDAAVEHRVDVVRTALERAECYAAALQRPQNRGRDRRLAAAASAGQAAESAEEPQITNISASDEDAQEE